MNDAAMVPAAGLEADGDRASHLFLILCCSLVAAFLVWSLVGRLDIVSQAVGEVIPSSLVKSIQHLEGGIVREIHVREGDKVKRDQPLVTLEPTQSGADVGELGARLLSLKADVARLEAEAAGKAPRFPLELVGQAPDLIEQAVKTYDSRRARVENQMSVQGEQIHQREREIDEIDSRLTQNRENLKLLTEQVKISEELLRDDLTNRMLHLNLLKEQSTLKGKIGEDAAMLRRANAALKEAEGRLKSISASFQEEVRKELDEKSRALDELSTRFKKFEDSLQRTVLRSPVDGIVKSLYVTTQGGVIKSGGTVADVVPIEDRLVVEAQLPPQEIGYVAVGQGALIRLNSSDQMRFGAVSGTVVSISPDTIAGEKGQSFYRVRIETDQGFFKKGDLTYQLLPGVKVVASIRTGSRSVFEYIFYPFLGQAGEAFRER